MGNESPQNTIVGVFDTKAAADEAVSDLLSAGYHFDQIGMTAKDGSGNIVRVGESPGTPLEEGASVGLTVGTLAGTTIGAGVLA